MEKTRALYMYCAMLKYYTLTSRIGLQTLYMRYTAQ